MISWFNYIVESSLVLALLLLFYQVVLSKEKCIIYNRYYLLFTGVASVIIPTLNLSNTLFQAKESALVPIYELPAIVSQLTTFSKPQTSGLESFLDFLTFVYLLGLVWVLIRLIIKLIMIFRLIKSAKPIITSPNYKVFLTHGKYPSCSFYKFLFLNEQNKSKQELDAIIAHEQAHISQKHSFDILFLELYKIIFWFNPLSYQLAKNVRLNHEYLADYSVVQATNKRFYINTLLSSIYKQTISEVVHYFGLHSTEKRIQMMCKSIKWTTFYKPYFSIPFLGILFFTFSCHFEPAEIVPNTVGFETAPNKFKEVINALQSKNPNRRYFFKLTSNLELEKIKALDYGSYYTIDYQAPLKGYNKHGFGMVYSFDKNRNLPKEIFSMRIYNLEEVTQIPTPWNGYENLLATIDANANQQVVVKEDKTIWVKFILGATGSISFTNISGQDYTTMTKEESEQFGAAIRAVNATSSEWRVGKINNTLVNVALELPVRLYKN